MLFLYGCSVSWTKAIQYGSVVPAEFQDTVQFKVQNGLIFLDVKINGERFKFLYDTGAPFSISEEIQEEFSFKKVSSGHIKDSDHNRKAIDWVQVDSIQIGGITFLDQTAFVGDFSANPVIKCIGFDGIVGSNLMRHSNWIIDPVSEEIIMSSDLKADWINGLSEVPFSANNQYSMRIDVNIGRATIHNVLVDFGSNRSVSLSDEILSVLKDRNIANIFLEERGFRQTGIVGEPVKVKKEVTITDSLSLGGLPLSDVMIETGKTVSLGTDVLTRYHVVIDWDQHHLYLKDAKTIPHPEKTVGFKLGYTDQNGVYFESVLENSEAHNRGIRDGMKVMQLDDLIFKEASDFCDYVGYEYKDSVFVQFKNQNGELLSEKFPVRLITDYLDEFAK